MPGSTPITRWRKSWRRSLRARLLVFALAPLLVAFPIVLSVLVTVGGARFDNLLKANAAAHLASARNYLDQTRILISNGVAQMAASDRLNDLLRDEVPGSELLHNVLSARAEGANLDFLILAAEDGRIIGASTTLPAGARLPDGFVLRQAQSGFATSGYELLDADQLAALSPSFAEKSRVAAGVPQPQKESIENRGLLISAASHFPLSNDHVNAILVGGILLNRGDSLVDRIRDVVFPVGGHADAIQGTTTLFLQDVAVAGNIDARTGLRPIGMRADPEAARAVLERGEVWIGRTAVENATHMAGFEPIVDSQGTRVGMLYVGIPDAPFQAEKWLMLGGVAALLAAAMLAMSVLFMRGAKRSVERLGQIGRAMKRIEDGERHTRVGQAGEEDEIGRLARHFDSLLDTLDEQEEARRSAQQAVSAEASRRRALFEHDRDGVVVLNEDGSVLEANRQFAAMLGYSVQEAGGLHVWDWELNLEQSEWPAWRERACPGANLHQTTHRRQDGTTYQAETSYSRVEWGGQTYLLCLQRDMTERLKVDAELEQHRHHLEQMVLARTKELATARDEAQSANRAKSHFLANMSHELRTPMNVIMGMAQLALRRATDPRQIGQLTRVGQASSQLLALINNLLDLARIEAGRLALEQSDFTLGGIEPVLRGLFEQKAAEKGLHLGIAFDSGLADLGLRGDATRLQQVLANLIDNAIKFSHAGQVLVRAQLEMDAPTEVLLHCEVRDHGIGITAADQQRLFAAFEQADGSMTRTYGGSGLGLAISRRLVQLMGGEIGVDSEQGVGSRFWFTARFGKSPIVAISPAQGSE
jgi:PAS domain S-box-containing protein